MLNVFVEKLHVRLSNGRLMSLEDLVMDYERLLAESSKKEVTPKPKEIVPTASKLEVGKWFLIDREIINQSKEEICRKCNEAGIKGAILWQRFSDSNKIANMNPNQYPRLIETYIFENDWKYKTEQKMRDMCEEVGDGMCDEVICDLELQMRICNGESVEDLLQKADKLPCIRVIKLRNGETALFGGAVNEDERITPTSLFKCPFRPKCKHTNLAPYAFQRLLS